MRFHDNHILTTQILNCMFQLTYKQKLMNCPVVRAIVKTILASLFGIIVTKFCLFSTMMGNQDGGYKKADI